ncbi:MAG: DMP19 family protein [Prevotellaceae bacterium]|nr:DMP19 family protein [Prevotella sp.]MDD7258152.1 DMP19 family protein [Prevotellaceae bacterium]MDY6130995.1 DMP19 family protein [Prevotella sp.]
MKEITIKDSTLSQAASEGMDAFVQVFADAVNEAIGGQLTAESMSELNGHQMTLLAYMILREEVMDGGFIQLIHNGYGEFFFKNPFAKAMRLWGLDDLAKLMNKVRKSYVKNHEEIEKDVTDEEFMSLFEQHPEYDEHDDCFVENEEAWTEAVAHYIDENIDSFAKIVE